MASIESNESVLQQVSSPNGFAEFTEQQHQGIEVQILRIARYGGAAAISAAQSLYPNTPYHLLPKQL